MKTRKKANFLSYPQVKKLDEWLTTNLDRVKAGRYTIEQIADQVKKELGHEITAPNISGLLKKTGRSTNFARTGDSSTLRVKSPKIDATCRRLLALLYEKVGEQVPQELIDYLIADELLNTTVTSVIRSTSLPNGGGK